MMFDELQKNLLVSMSKVVQETIQNIAITSLNTNSMSGEMNMAEMTPTKDVEMNNSNTGNTDMRAQGLHDQQKQHRNNIKEKRITRKYHRQNKE